MNRRLINVAAIIGALAFVAFTASPAVAAKTSAATMVEVSGRYAFSPLRLYVNVGGQATWTNSTDAPHTVTSDTAGGFDSGTVKAGGSFVQTFPSAGTFAYHCSIHPYMTGSVVVLPASATPPPTTTATRTMSADPGDVAVRGGLITLGMLAGIGLVARRFRDRRRLPTV